MCCPTSCCILCLLYQTFAYLFFLSIFCVFVFFASPCNHLPSLLSLDQPERDEGTGKKYFNFLPIRKYCNLMQCSDLQQWIPPENYDDEGEVGSQKVVAYGPREHQPYCSYWPGQTIFWREHIFGIHIDNSVVLIKKIAHKVQDGIFWKFDFNGVRDLFPTRCWPQDRLTRT